MSMIADLVACIRTPGTWTYSTWIAFLMRYRKTIVGPAWLLLGPIVFIGSLGLLFSLVNGSPVKQFIPHLSAGLIIWSFISTTVLIAPRLFIQSKPILLQGFSSHMEIVLGMLFSNIIVFAHQAIVIALVMIVYDINPGVRLLLVIPSGILLVVHGFWLTIAIGILGARYRDLGEIAEMIMRIAFLMTPIIWIPGAAHGEESIVQKYLLLNPFYHVLEPIRGALLGTEIAPISWVISTTIAVLGLALAAILYERLRHLVVIWA